jgi:hypothetical protein
MSGAKLGIAGAIIVLKAAKRYLSDNQERLQRNVTTETYNCIVETLGSITTCLIALGTIHPNP